MAKGAAKKRRHGDVWTGADHAVRNSKHENKRVADATKVSYKDRRSALARGSKDKLDSGRLRLHIAKTQREVDRVRERLRVWDDLKEEEEKQRLLQQQQQEQEEPKKKKRGRLGPETWKLRGAARPAWEVYDFDTRYVDPHVKAHKDAKEKAQRCRNLLVIYKGRLGHDDGPPQPYCRNFLALLMQLGMLCLQAKKYKAARSAFLECMDLDGSDHPITMARCQLMRMYLEANRPLSARRLWERLPNDTSVWIRYSAALLEYVSWKLLGEKGSNRESAEALLAQAIRANIFCAYYIAYHETFERVMEYTEEIQDANEQTLEEAIEYCCSEQMGAWVGTEGAIPWLQNAILRTHRGRSDDGSESLVHSDLDWSDKLKMIEDDFIAVAKVEDEEEQKMASTDASSEEEKSDSQPSDNDSSEEEPDVLMYAGMFRTAMDMLEDAGEFVKDIEDSEGEDEKSANEDGKKKRGNEEESSGDELGAEQNDSSDSSDSS